MQRIKKGRILHGATLHNGVVYTSGLTADDLEAGMAGQTKQICDKFDALLADSGTDKFKIIRAEIYVTDLSKKGEIDAVWLEWLGEDLPCRCTVGVSSLGDPRTMIEIMLAAASSTPSSSISNG
tara:strand:- start:43876 stop:44247 length:372 start_codon:yes stop_codon:yes gene_type:complete